MCVSKIRKFLRQASGIIRKIPCYQSTTALRSFVVKVRILQNAFKIYLEQLPGKNISFIILLSIISVYEETGRV